MSARRTLSVAAVLGVTALLIAPLFAASAPPAEPTSRVEIIYADGPSAEGIEAPRIAAEETADLLTRGGAGAPKVVQASSAGGFLRSIEEARAETIVLIAHADAEGVHVAGEPAIPWPVLREALSGSAAKVVALGMCYSALVGEIEAKSVVTTFDGEIDYRAVPVVVAVDLASDVYPDLEIGIRDVVDPHVEKQGGLEAYLGFFFAPEHPLSYPPEYTQHEMDRCTDAVEAWNRGEFPNAERCVVYVPGPGATNCHNAEHERDSPCTEFNGADQTAANEDSQPSATPTGGDPESGGADGVGSSGWYDALNKVVGFSASLGSNKIEFKAGNLDSFKKCVDILRLEDIMSGGSTWAIEMALERLRVLFGNTGGLAWPSPQWSMLALRLCGSVKSEVPRISQQHTTNGWSAQISAYGQLDVKLSTYLEVSLEKLGKVFKFLKNVKVKADTGLAYPFTIGGTGRLHTCTGSDGKEHVGWEVRIGVDGRGLEWYFTAKNGWTEWAFKHGFGGEFTFPFERWWDCGPGSAQYQGSGSPQSSSAAIVQPTSPLALDPLQTTLIERGYAFENPNPTLFKGVNGDNAVLSNGFLIVRAGAGDFNGFAAKGVFEKLGIDADLPLGTQVVLDLTNKDVLAAMGGSKNPPIPRVSLVDGFAILPGAAPTAMTNAGYCQLNAGIGDPVMETVGARFCVGVGSFNDIPTPYAELDFAARGPRRFNLAGPLEGSGAETGNIRDVSLGVQHTCAISPPLVNATCTDARRAIGATSEGVEKEVYPQIHNMMQYLDRNLHSITFLSACNFAPVEGADPLHVSAGIGPADGVPLGMQTNVTACLQFDDLSGAIPMDLKHVADDLALGHEILAMVTAHTPIHAVAAASRPSDVVAQFDLSDPVNSVWRQVCENPSWPAGCE